MSKTNRFNITKSPIAERELAKLRILKEEYATRARDGAARRRAIEQAEAEAAEWEWATHARDVTPLRAKQGRLFK